MASINYAAREISVKIVYYGPGLSGKTTNLQVIHKKVPPEYKSDMVSLATETDRTLFFDFLPLDLGTIKGFSTKFQLYTVPGQVYYNATRKLVLRGVDGIIFVADSAPDKIQEGLESFQNLEDNLAEYGYQRENIPIVIQYNKRDLPNALPLDKLDKIINKYHSPYNEAIANKGKGVFESLKIMGKCVIDNLNTKYSTTSRGSDYGAPAAARATAAAAARATTPVPVRPPPPLSAAPRSVSQQPLPRTISQKPVAVNDPFLDNYQDVAPRAKPVQPPPLVSPRAPNPAPADYLNYGAINLEPMDSHPSVSPQTPVARAPVQQFSPPPPRRSEMQSQQGRAEQKTDLDMEIERYQREIEEKQRSMSSGPATSDMTPPPQRMPRFAPVQPDFQTSQESEEMQYLEEPAPQNNNYQSATENVAPSDDDAVSEDTLYFTSVNTDRPRRKIKKPVNPKSKNQQGFFGRLFNKNTEE